VLLALVLAPLVAGTPAAAAQPGAAAAGTLDGRSRLTVTLPGDGREQPAAGSATVTADGQQVPARLTPMLSERTATVVVVDASDAAGPALQPGLSGAASFTLSAPAAARSGLVADTDPPAVIAPLEVGPAATVRGLATVRSGGQRRTSAALDLAMQQLPPGADDPRLVVLYTAAPDAGGPAVADLAARLTAAGTVLAVVVPGPAGAAVPPYWSAVANATGGPAVAAGGAGAVAAFDRLAADLRTRYLVTFPAPGVLPATAVVRVDTPQGAVTAEAVVPPVPAAPASTSAARGGARMAGAVVATTVVLALLVFLGVRAQRTRRRPGSGGGTAAARGNTATAWRIPGRADPSVDREPLLAAIRAAVRDGGRAVLRPAGGAAGLGATSAMAEFAHRRRRDYDIAWWVPAADPPLVADRLAELAEALGLAEQTDTAEEATERLLAALRRRDRWVLVLDDAASPRQLARFLPQGPGHVLVASDDPEWAQHGAAVSVGPFRRDESVVALRARVSGLSAAEADRVAGALEDVPQAVDLAGATLAETGMGVSTYLRLLEGHADGAGAAAAVALDRLATDDPSTLALLTMLAWLAPDPVPLSLLGGHPDVLPAPLAGIADPSRLTHLVAAAHRRALARADAGTVQLHPTQAALLVARSGDDGTWAASAVRLLHAAAPDDPAAREQWRALLPHVLAATDPARRLDAVLVEVGRLLHGAAAYLRARGEPRAARALFEDAYDVYRLRLGPDHPDTVACARTLADDLEALGEHEQARRVRHDAGVGGRRDHDVG
jgi:hypothetical protein